MGIGTGQRVRTGRMPGAGGERVRSFAQRVFGSLLATGRRNGLINLCSCSRGFGDGKMKGPDFGRAMEGANANPNLG